MFCPNCGNRVEDGEEFCASCGIRIAGTPENEEYARNDAGEYNNAADEKETRRKRKGIKVILQLVLVIGVVTFAWGKKDSLYPLLEKMNQKIVSDFPEKETSSDAEEDSEDWEKQINRKENWIDHSRYIDSSAQISSSDMDTMEQFGKNYVNSRFLSMFHIDESDEGSITDINYAGSSFWKAQDNIGNPWNIIFLYYEVTLETSTYYTDVPIGNLEKMKDGSINLDEDRLMITHLGCTKRDSLEELEDAVQEWVESYYSKN